MFQRMQFIVGMKERVKSQLVPRAANALTSGASASPVGQESCSRSQRFWGWRSSTLTRSFRMKNKHIIYCSGRFWWIAKKGCRNIFSAYQDEINWSHDVKGAMLESKPTGSASTQSSAYFKALEASECHMKLYCPWAILCVIVKEPVDLL